MVRRESGAPRGFSLTGKRLLCTQLDEGSSPLVSTRHRKHKPRHPATRSGLRAAVMVST